jgi:tryptophanyl-tRNA synthetase
VDCKKKLAEGVIEHFAPLRERRAEYENDPKKLDEIIADGCERARKVAGQTMDKVHDAMGIG